MDPTPLAEGFVMPAEWTAHARCWMAWPCRAETWRDQIMEARLAFAEVARAISRFEPVTMLAQPGQVAEASLACGPGIDVMPIELDDSWTRDTAPTFVMNENGELAGVDWGFNGWGNTYRTYDKDAALAAGVLDHLGLRRFTAPMIMEGGAIHVDGEGTVIATEQCLLNENRNPLMSRQEIEATILDHVGARKMIWLGNGLEDDETDGHVDNVAAFAKPGTILVTMPGDENDPDHAVMQDNVARLNEARDAAGRALEVIALPQPKRRMHNDKRITMSYVNFYLANGAVIMPAFDDAADSKARAAMSKVFPDREIVQILALDIVAGGGGIHCITQQQPAVEQAPTAESDGA